MTNSTIRLLLNHNSLKCLIYRWILYLPRRSSTNTSSLASRKMISSTCARAALSWAPTRAAICLGLNVSNGLLANIFTIFCANLSFTWLLSFGLVFGFLELNRFHKTAADEEGLDSRVASHEFAEHFRRVVRAAAREYDVAELRCGGLVEYAVGLEF